MVHQTSWLLVLSHLVQYGFSDPLPIEAPRLVERDTEFDIVEAIPLLRSAHDLQHSSRALRKKAVNLDFDQLDGSATPGPDTYQNGFALLRSTGASFLAPISFDEQSFLHVLDTGSADTVSCSDPTLPPCLT